MNRNPKEGIAVCVDAVESRSLPNTRLVTQRLAVLLFTPAVRLITQRLGILLLILASRLVLCTKT
jgi:hypothetical protein